jgi:hypothetical protein
LLVSTRLWIPLGARPPLAAVDVLRSVVVEAV